MEKFERQQIKKEDSTEKKIEEIVKATMGQDVFEREDKTPEAKDLGAAAKKEKKQEPEVNPNWHHHVETERNRLMGKVEVAEKNVKAAETELEETKKRFEKFKQELAKAQKLLAELEAEKKADKLSKEKKEMPERERLDRAA